MASLCWIMGNRSLPLQDPWWGRQSRNKPCAIPFPNERSCLRYPCQWPIPCHNQDRQSHQCPIPIRVLNGECLRLNSIPLQGLWWGRQSRNKPCAIPCPSGRSCLQYPCLWRVPCRIRGKDSHQCPIPTNVQVSKWEFVYRLPATNSLSQLFPQHLALLSNDINQQTCLGPFVGWAVS